MNTHGESMQQVPLESIKEVNGSSCCRHNELLSIVTELYTGQFDVRVCRWKVEGRKRSLQYGRGEILKKYWRQICYFSISSICQHYFSIFQYQIWRLEMFYFFYITEIYRPNTDQITGWRYTYSVKGSQIVESNDFGVNTCREYETFRIERSDWSSADMHQTLNQFKNKI